MGTQKLPEEIESTLAWLDNDSPTRSVIYKVLDELLDALAREQHKEWAKTFTDIKDGSKMCDKDSLDLLVKYGRMEKVDGIYRWKES